MPLPFHRLAPAAVLAAVLLAGCGNLTSQPQPTAVPTEPTLAPPLAGSYVAMGASETYGVGAVPRTRGYAFLLSHDLRARHFLDTGIPGATIDAGYQTELTSALNARPALVTVFFGVNDFQAGVSRAGFLQDLGDLVGTLRQAKARVLIIGMPNVALLPAVARLHFADLPAIVASWNAGMKQVARRYGAMFVDLASFSHELADHKNYIAADGLHPSNTGHARLAQILFSAITHQHLWRPA